MSGTIGGFMGTVGSDASDVYFVIIVLAGWNFVAEFIINAVLSPAIYTVARVVGRSVRKSRSMPRPQRSRRRKRGGKRSPAKHGKNKSPGTEL